jgi:nucleoid DNA-binding protein
MNKSQLVQHVSQRTKLPRKEVWLAVDTTLDCIKKYTRKRGGVSIAGFGTFHCWVQSPHKKYNPRTKRYQWAKGIKQVRFTPTPSWGKPMYS